MRLEKAKPFKQNATETPGTALEVNYDVGKHPVSEIPVYLFPYSSADG